MNHFPGITPEDIERMAALPDEQRAAAMDGFMEKLIGFSFDPANPQQALENLIALKFRHDQYHRDLRLVVRILLDLGKVFGVVDEHDAVKQMEENEYGSAIISKLTALMSDYAFAKVPGPVGKRYEKKLMDEFIFLKAIIPMAGKYPPATREELKEMIQKA